MLLLTAFQMKLHDDKHSIINLSLFSWVSRQLFSHKSIKGEQTNRRFSHNWFCEMRRAFNQRIWSHRQLLMHPRYRMLQALGQSENADDYRSSVYILNLLFSCCFFLPPLCALTCPGVVSLRCDRMIGAAFFVPGVHAEVWLSNFMELVKWGA